MTDGTKHELDLTFDHEGQRYWLHKVPEGAADGRYQVELVITDPGGSLSTHEVELHVTRSEVVDD